MATPRSTSTPMPQTGSLTVGPISRMRPSSSHSTRPATSRTLWSRLPPPTARPARDRDARGGPPGQVPAGNAEPVLQAPLLKQARGAVPRGPSLDAGHVQRQLHVLPRGQRLPPVERLEHEPDTLAPG